MKRKVLALDMNEIELNVCNCELHDAAYNVHDKKNKKNPEWGMNKKDDSKTKIWML